MKFRYNWAEMFRLFATVALVYGVALETGLWTTVFVVLVSVRFEVQALIKKIRDAQELDAWDKAIESLDTIGKK